MSKTFHKKFYIYLTMLASLMLLLVLSFAIINCDGEALTKNTIEKVIGSDGGTLLGPIGSMIIVPKGALDEDIIIVATEIIKTEVTELGNGELISVGVLLEPKDLILNTPITDLSLKLPITIYMPYARGDLSEAQQQDNVDLYVMQQDSDEWKKLSGTIDLDQHLSMSESETLGVFAVFFVPDTTDGDADGDTDTESDVELE